VTIQTATANRLDELTAGVIRQALAAAQSGRLKDACAIAEAGLAAGGDLVAINALLGTLKLDLGETEAAVRHLEFAHERRRLDVRIATNLATALVVLERFDRAFDVASRELAFADPTLQLARIRAYAADQLGDFPAAAEVLERVVAAMPADCESWNNLGNARRGVGDWEGSVEALRRAVGMDPTSAPIRLNYANALRDAAHFDEAETAFRKMIEDFPGDTQPLRRLHLLLKQLNRSEEALQPIEAAVDHEPTNVELLLAKASHLSELHRMKDSEATYQQVIDLDPTNSTAHLGLAFVYDMTNRVDDLSALSDQAEERGVDENALNFIRAYKYLRAKRYEAGLAALDQVPAELESIRRYHLQGQLLDRAGRYDEAFAAFSRMTELFAEDPTHPEERGAGYRDAVRRSLDIVTADWVRSWRPELTPDPRPAPVFLVGFPRSGTTLLDTILMSHPQIEVLEEEPALRKAHALVPDFEGLASVDEDQIRAARDRYFETAATLTPLAPGNLLIDKNPLTMNLLPLVRRLFPDARIILALRHPCDVILSCFIANFRLNDGMSSFLRLLTAAELYDLSFRYYEHVQKLMPMPTHTVVYENVVADRERELRGLFDFLGLEWHDAVLDHQATALKRGRIKTASYAQVVEPIYKRSAGRWHHYRKHLEPILPVLAPWAEKFGYSI
jgi:tetratricopeptide (TPR) repeat protein